jgi:hypothetical protein
MGTPRTTTAEPRRCRATLAEESRALSLWDLATGKKLLEHTGMRHPAKAVAVDPAGELAASFEDEDAVWIWSLEAPAGPG